TYASGESVPYDSCNTCSCGQYGIMCTLRACPEHLGGCLVHGKWYYSGTYIPAPDGCNTCLCENGEKLVCVSVWKMKAVIVLVAVASLHCFVAQGLPEPVSSCKHNGQTYEIGEIIPYDSCNICKCGVYGIMCTLMACPDNSGRCYVNGKWYESGTSVPKADGCNTCLCQNGQLTICTKMACIHI
ncbi:von Willebrand factor C and EGF domain-containing protein, partial [Biomphalaria glabrata]